MHIYWSQRLYVRVYVALLAGNLILGLLYGIAWHMHKDPGPGQRNPMNLVLVLALIALAVALAAFPVVRRLTRRLERLQHSVEALGAGDLTTRVTVEGRDEVSRLAESFNRSAAHIEVLLNSQRTLLSNASHELRSPLTRMRMAVELMQERAPPQIRSELTRSIAELDQLIDEILLASRLDAVGEAAPQYELLDFTALVAEECVAVDAQLEAQAVSLCGDARLLRRMLRNLLENAKRYGADTPIRVRLSMIAGPAIQLDISDSGPGVPAGESENVFTAFYRLPGSSEQAGGVGLGLSLVRQIATAHGGSVHCVSTAGSGSCFRVLLPALSTQDGTSKRQSTTRPDAPMLGVLSGASGCTH